MARIIIALISGIALGGIAMIAFERSPSISYSMSPTAATNASAPHTAVSAPQSIDDVLALRGEFQRAAALHVLAARSDAATVQELIQTAFELVPSDERTDALRILFFRLAELQARVALELSRSEQFAPISALQQTVWRVWARNDLDAAMFEAKTQTTLSDQKRAAQYLFAASGYMENSTIARIETELGVAPDRSNRSRYLYRLADQSAADAIDFINRVSDKRQRSEYISWLAARLYRQDASDALRFSGLFDDRQDSARYEQALNRSIARDDPVAALQRLAADGVQNTRNTEYRTAVEALAKLDLDTAKQFFSEAQTAGERRTLGNAIASEMAKDDPVAALAWAQSNDVGEFPYLQMSALTQIARTNPQLALMEALKTRNAQMRSNMVGNVMQQIARKDPASAAAMLQQIPNSTQRRDASQHLASAWVQTDADAAIEWLIGQDAETVSRAMPMVSMQLVHNDIDAAMRLLPRLSEVDQTSLRAQIAQRLAMNRSPEAAQTFVRQFEGQRGYAQLQANLIAGVAQNDVLLARQLADQLSAGHARDSAYVNVISQRAHTNPEEAARWLQRVGDEAMRGSATGQVAAQWFQQDPDAAERWVADLPAGISKDDAIMHISFQWPELSAAHEDLIASIENKEKRAQAKLRQVYHLMRSDPVKARELLQDEDISSVQRQQLELMISQYGIRF